MSSAGLAMPRVNSLVLGLFGVVLFLIGSTALKGQYQLIATPHDSSLIDVNPSISLTASLSGLSTPRPSFKLEAQFVRFDVPVLHTSRLGISIRGSASIPGIPMQEDTVPDGIRGLLGGGMGFSLSAWPYIHLRYFDGLTGYLYFRYEQHVWTGVIAPASDLYASRMSLPGICLIADVNKILKISEFPHTVQRSVFFDVAFETIRFQSLDEFTHIIRGLSEEDVRYLRVRLGFQLASTQLYVEKITYSTKKLWSAGLVIPLNY